MSNENMIENAGEVVVEVLISRSPYEVEEIRGVVNSTIKDSGVLIVETESGALYGYKQYESFSITCE